MTRPENDHAQRADARPAHGREALRRLLEPVSVALVGASSNPASLGGRTLANLLSFPGRLYPVNGRHTELAGHRCYPAVSDLPERPDCVVLAVPQDAVEALAIECADFGAGALVVLASGYAEVDEAGAQAQQRLVALARRSGIRIVGPNCVGVANRGAGLLAAFAEFPPGPSVAGARVGLVAQSGALGLGLSQAAEGGMSISHVLTCGNSCDVDVADYVAFLAEDDSCDSIALAFEGVGDPARMSQALALAAMNGKPVAACKLGTSEAGRAAARWHTNTATEVEGGWPALFAATGTMTVQNIEVLMETAAFLAKAPRAGKGKGVAVLSGSGGTAILAMDAAARHGLTTPQPSAQTCARLAAAVPAFGSPRNPCDATAQATRNPQSLLECADALLADAQYSALVIPWGRSQPARLLEDIDVMAARHGKPVCVVWMSQRLESATTEMAHGLRHVALFHSLESCVAALAHHCLSPRGN